MKKIRLRRIGNKDAEKENSHTTTTFQLSHHLHTQLKTMCILTNKSMGEFIRSSIIDKINELKNHKI